MGGYSSMALPVLVLVFSQTRFFRELPAASVAGLIRLMVDVQQVRQRGEGDPGQLGEEQNGSVYKTQYKQVSTVSLGFFFGGGGGGVKNNFVSIK